MGLNVYYPQDIRNALLAAEQASYATLVAVGVEGDPFTRGYQEGYQAALTTIALAFGLVNKPGQKVAITIVTQATCILRNMSNAQANDY